MGDRYELCRECAYCGKMNEDIWYAPTSGSDTFECKHCGKKNFVDCDFKVKKIADVTLQDVIAGFSMTTNVSWEDGKIEEMCQERLHYIKK